MPTLSGLTTLANGTANDAGPVNTNFTDIVNFINTNSIQKDASLAFTGVPSGPSTDPSSNDQLTRKLYVDRRVGHASGATTGGTTAFSSFDTYINMATGDITVPNGIAVTVLAWGTYLALGHNGASAFYQRCAVSLDNGASYTYGVQSAATTPSTLATGGTAVTRLSGTPSAPTIKVVLQVQQRTSFSTFSSIFEPTVTALVLPTTGGLTL